MDIDDLLNLADTYNMVAGTSDKTLSNRIFGDSKKLTAMRNGADITVGRFNCALVWFSINWPMGAEWPDAIQRPKVDEVPA